jgi:hypothetical protein
MKIIFLHTKTVGVTEYLVNSLADLPNNIAINLIESGFAQAYSGNIPTALSQLTDDSTHRLTTDAEKSVWNLDRSRSIAYAVAL